MTTTTMRTQGHSNNNDNDNDAAVAADKEDNKCQSYQALLYNYQSTFKVDGGDGKVAAVETLQ
jgi:hypothetical protein